MSDGRDRRRYLRKTGLQACLAAWLEHPACARPLPEERVPTPRALGRVTAGPVYARRSVPSAHCAAMDGVAVCAEDTFGASEVSPRQLDAGQYLVVDTGDPVPEDRDAVIMAEDLRWLAGGGIEIVQAAPPWQHVRLAGEDVVATEMLLPGGHRLRPMDVAALLSAGVREVAVRRRPRVAVLPTGDELVDALAPQAEQDRRGAILETNSYLIAGMVEEWGGEAERSAPVRDNVDEVRAALLFAVEEFDVIAFNAGSSAGREDFVPQVIEAEGELLAHGIDVMPGKPAALGVVRDRPVLGIPGYPVSAYVICEQFLRPLLHRLQGRRAPEVDRVPALMGRKTPSRLGDEEFVRVKAARVGEKLVVAPLPRGASLLNSVVRADGIVRIPAPVEGVEAGETVWLQPLRPLAEIELSLLAIGSHDLLLDLLGDFLQRRQAGYSLSSAHVGSLGGLSALRRGECHLAGTHLIDEETGEYNVTWVRRLFPQGGIALVHLARRQQGLIVPRGNPDGLGGLVDLANEGVQFLNRQRGSGTRQLLDFQLRQHGIDPERIRGYHREAYTHLAVAAAVASGGANAGLGILAAAKALDLGFVPVGEESYELAMSAETLGHPAVRQLMEIVVSPEFRSAAEALGGYDLRESGQRRI
jgi:putative molybdopterin biosynthesis protein